MKKLLIIRGNSGSGKSTIAKLLRNKLKEHKTALIEQDYLRRHVLGETGKSGDDNVELIENSARFALGKGYVTIIEGIMPSEYYGDMLKSLINDYRDKTTVVYLDIPLEETIQRHWTKPNSEDFGEKELRDWYREQDLLGLSEEILINQEFSLEQSVNLILEKIS